MYSAHTIGTRSSLPKPAERRTTVIDISDDDEDHQPTFPVGHMADPGLQLAPLTAVFTRPNAPSPVRGVDGALINLPSPLQKIKDVFDGGLLDFWTIVSNMPPKEGDTVLQYRFRWIAWGIDTLARVVKLLSPKIGLSEELSKQINVIISCVVTCVDSYLRVRISREEYFKNAKKKVSNGLDNFYLQSIAIGDATSLLRVFNLS
ncbi:uncharacterized protein B0H64DRAFT_462433 [Chaetomium fimeti]|uniref:Uncharacterized protein n=1 Tax=Chaetomium fimeti TaxID=1854472 RepID=A0AAE0LQF0_9PEZI|nr:hypothetical protein B0H64DRAFT_462433 [Chaetomium fimeti]